VKNQKILTKTKNGFLALGLAGALLPMAAAAEEKFEDKLTVDSAPIRRGSMVTSYADVLDGVRGAVVSVYTSKELEQRTTRDFRNIDPWLRQFLPPEIFQQHPNRPQLALGAGSGVVVTKDGYILTNNHVVKGADGIEVKFAESKKTYAATIVGTDPGSDIAVIKIEGKNDFPFATIADSSKLRVGDVVLAIGSPLDYEQTVTMGIVSALGRSSGGVLGANGFEDFIQTDASINPGNSGGALVDARGRVVGINTAIVSGNGGNIGIGFAVPSNMAVSVAQAIVDTGEVNRGFLGVQMQDLDEELAARFDKEDLKGVLINAVVGGSPAEKAGFRDKDIVVGYRGRKIEDSARFRLHVGSTLPGEEVEFEILRDGKIKKLTAVLAKRDASQFAGGGIGRFRTPDTPVNKELIDGVELDSLNDAARSELRLNGGVKGVLVTNVDPASTAAEAGLSKGHIITEVDGQQVASLKDVEKAMENAKLSPLLIRIVSSRGGAYLAFKVGE